MKRMLFGCMMLAIAASLGAAPGDIHYISVLQTEVKTEPSEDAETMFIVALGRKVMEFSRQDGWANVGIDRTGGKDGWIRVEHLQPNEP